MIEINVEPKKQYLPLNYQPVYKVAQILMILNYNAQTKSESISFLHTISWAIRDKKNTKILLEFINKERESLVPWCFEPALDKALIIALVNGFCTRLNSGDIKLTKKGKDYISMIEKENIFKESIATHKEIGSIAKKLFNSLQNWEVNL